MASEIRHTGPETYGPYPSTPGCKVAWVQETCGRESHEALKCMVVGRIGGAIEEKRWGPGTHLYHQYLLKVVNRSENSVGATL